MTSRPTSPLRKKLPIGIQTFAKIREGGGAYYYVDKTPHILRLIDEGSHYFLSRPRRFGKSLLLDTLAELFEGRRELFEGLHADAHWDWSQRFPVIRISFGGGVLRNRAELDQRLNELLRSLARRFGIECADSSVPGRFSELIQTLHARSGQRVEIGRAHV